MSAVVSVVQFPRYCRCPRGNPNWYAQSGTKTLNRALQATWNLTTPQMYWSRIVWALMFSPLPAGVWPDPAATSSRVQITSFVGKMAFRWGLATVSTPSSWRVWNPTTPRMYWSRIVLALMFSPLPAGVWPDSAATSSRVQITSFAGKMAFRWGLATVSTPSSWRVWNLTTPRMYWSQA